MNLPRADVPGEVGKVGRRLFWLDRKRQRGPGNSHEWGELWLGHFRWLWHDGLGQLLGHTTERRFELDQLWTTAGQESKEKRWRVISGRFEMGESGEGCVPRSDLRAWPRRDSDTEVVLATS